MFDLPEVCPLAADYARHYGLSQRIGTHSGDMWRDPYPAADLHLYSNIFHDWPMDKNRFRRKELCGPARGQDRDPRSAVQR